MPRIDPLDLLKCLGVLLSSNGGIKGPTEVDRVARLMLRFSKKLVSKCIYIHVLKATSTELLDQFLNQNGAYALILKWLAEAHQTRNTPLLAEMLELLQLLPLSDARLKDPHTNEFIRTSLHYNDLAQLVQSIVQEYNDQNCRNLAMQFWSRWFSKPSQPEEFSLTQEGILPEDMDLSIYAPDTSSATFGDPMNMSIGDDVGIAINNLNNLSSLDMNNCAQFMENSEFYNMNHFESTSLTNNLEQANHQVFMDSPAPNFGNDALTNQQQLLHQLQQQTQPMQPTMLQQQALVHPVMNPPMDPTSVLLPQASNWASTNLGTAHVIPESNQGQMAIGEVKTPESTSGLPILKIKIEGRKYVVKNSTDDVEMKEEIQNCTETYAETKEKEKSQEKDKDKEKTKEKDKEREKSRDKDKKKDRDRKSSSRSKDDGKKSSSDSKKKDKEKDREKSKSSSSSSRDKSSSSSSSSKEKSRSSSSRDEKRDKDRDKDKSKSKSSSKTEAQLKEAKQAEKNRETLATLKAMTPVVKLAKIPRKKVEDTAEASAEATASQLTANAIDVLDKLAPRPKTVKTFNSKFRSTGLVDEPAIPGSKKSAASSPSAVEKKSPVIKRTGSSDGLLPPADKKMKTIDDSAISAAVAAVMKKTAGELKPAVKLISPRPRPLLQDSSLFMDALEAGSKASTKKKRPLKDGAEIPAAPAKSQDSPAPLSVASPAPPLTPPIASSSVPNTTAPSTTSSEANTGNTSPVPLKPMFKFYQDTLEADEAATNEEEKIKPEPKQSKEESAGSPTGEKDDETVEGTVEAEDGNSRDSNKTEIGDEEIATDEKKPKGVLVIHSQQKRRPKKTLKWREDHELERHHFFELDETERVNVNKLQFFEMKQAEREREKQAVKMSKHLTEEAEVEEQPWKPLIPIDVPEDRVVYGENSQEKHIQEARESSTLQALYFKGQILPDSPAEPDPEVPLERVAEPTVIPLDDVTGNPESIYDHRHVAWPEPKSYGSSSSYQSHQAQLPKHSMGAPHQPYGPPSYRGPGAGPVEPYYPERGPGIHGDHPGYGSHPDAHGYVGPGMHPDGPDAHLGGPDMAYGGPDVPYGGPDGLHGVPPVHQYQTGRTGPPGRTDDRGAWMTGDGPGYPEHGVPRYDGPPHRDQRLPRDPYREMDHPRDRGMGGGFGDRLVAPGPGYIGPPRGMSMDGPRPRFHGPPRGGRGGGPPPGRGGPSTQPCWHFMRGFCRLENRCKFLHPNNYNGAQMP